MKLILPKFSSPNILVHPVLVDKVEISLYGGIVKSTSKSKVGLFIHEFSQVELESAFENGLAEDVGDKISIMLKEDDSLILSTDDHFIGCLVDNEDDTMSFYQLKQTLYAGFNAEYNGWTSNYEDLLSVCFYNGYDLKVE